MGFDILVGLTTVLYYVLGPLMAAAGIYWVRTARDRVDASLGVGLVAIGLLVCGTWLIDPVWWQGLVPLLPYPSQ
jgi:hypothetical protein